MSAVICDTTEQAVAGIEDGSTVLISGFGMAGMPVQLIDTLIEQGSGDLTVVSNNAGNGDTGLAALLAKGRVLIPTAGGLVGVRRLVSRRRGRA
jgi:3-oxoadipate CoA-transferase alpha subunit